MINEYKIRLKKRRRYLIVLSIIIGINLLDLYYANIGPTFLTMHPLQSAWNMNMMFYGKTILSGLTFCFLAFFLAALPMSDTIVEDMKSGYLNQVLLRKSQNKYLFNVYINNFIYGGLTIFATYFINLIMWLILRPMFPMNYVSSGFSNYDMFINTLSISPFLFYLLQLFVRFIIGGLIASFALFLNTFFKNSYIGLLGVLIVELIVNFSVYIYTILSHNNLVVKTMFGFFENMFCTNPLETIAYLIIILIIPIMYLYRLSKREVIV